MLHGNIDNEIRTVDCVDVNWSEEKQDREQR